MTSNRSIINRVRKKYNGDMQLAYDTEHKIAKRPLCPCGRERKFDNFIIGYNSYCISCKKQRYYDHLKSHPIKKYKVEDFLEDLYKNGSFYYKNYNKKNIFLPFFNRNIGEVYTVSSYIRKYFPKIFPKYDYKCSCGYVTKIDFFNINPVCKNPICIIRKFKEDLIKEKNKKHLWEKRDKNKDFVCPYTKNIFNITSSHDVKKINEHLEKLGKSIKDTMVEYFPNNVSYCLECNKPIFLSKNPLYKETKKFCCKEHYWEYKRKNPSLYEYSEETRKKHSTTITNKILEGKFTPSRNHYTNWGAIDSLSNKKYRSRWELIFHKTNPNLEYESKRLKYFDSEKNKTRTYIVDFYNPKTNDLYEIKPSCELNSQNVLDKRKSLIEFCENNNSKYFVITEDDIINEFDKADKSIFEEDVIECVLALKKQKLKKLGK